MSTNEIERRLSAPAPSIVSQATAVEQSRAVAEVAAAVQVAQMNPRDMNRAWAEMRAACSRLGLAERAFYRVPNRGEGASVHLARELARIWGNVDYGVHELHRDDARGISEVRAYAWDQQTNVRSSRTLQVPHARMTGKERRPLTDLGDIYLNNQNIGARAVRESIFTVLPADFVAEAQETCKATIRRGDGKPLPERIADTVAYFRNEFGVDLPRIETFVGRKRGQWTAADLADLSVAAGSIRRGEARADDLFPDQVTGDEIRQQATARKTVAAAPAADSQGYDPTTEPGWGQGGEG